MCFSLFVVLNENKVFLSPHTFLTRGRKELKLTVQYSLSLSFFWEGSYLVWKIKLNETESETNEEVEEDECHVSMKNLRP